MPSRNRLANSFFDNSTLGMPVRILGLDMIPPEDSQYRERRYNALVRSVCRDFSAPVMHREHAIEVLSEILVE